MIKVPESLKEALRKKRVIPFIGAGLSLNVRDKKGNPLFPDWPTLLRNTVEKLNDEGKNLQADYVKTALDCDPADYLQAAKYAREGLGAGWYDYLKEVFEHSHDEVDSESLELSRLCWQLGSNLLITGNYEDVLRWGCPKIEDIKTWDIESVKEQLDLVRNDAVTRFPTVWHLHGHIGNANNLILTPDGYATLYPEENGNTIEQKYKATLFILQILLTIRPFLFIGYSMNDKQFESQIRLISELFRETSNKHYILLQKDEAKFFEPRAYLDPIVFENFTDLPSILSEMANIASGKATIPYAASKVLFNVPFRSKGNEFVGREGKIEEIWEILNNAIGVGIGQAVCIEGMGGLGKTQLAVEYAHNYRDKYPNGVIWLTADGDMEGQLCLIALENGWVREFDTPENQLIIARQKLRNLNGALLIFDNIEKFEMIRPYLPKAGSNTHIISTSRHPIAEFHVLALKVLSYHDSIALLITGSRRTPTEEDVDAINKIVSDLDGLPLALEIAGASLRLKPTVSFAKYAELLENHMTRALPPKLARAGFTIHEQDVFQTLSISERIFDETPNIKRIIDLLTWSGSSSMGLSLMAYMLSVDAIDLVDALSLGVSMSLLKKEAESERYSIHRLLAKVRAEEIPLNDRKEWVGDCSKKLGDWFSSIKNDHAKLTDFESELEHLEAWEKNAALDFPENAVRLAYLKAYPVYHRGFFREAKNCAREALQQYKKRQLKDKLLYADIMQDIAVFTNAYRSQIKPLENSQRAQEGKKYAERGANGSKKLF